MIQQWIDKTRVGTRVHRRRVILIVGLGMLVLLILIQIFYPGDRLLPLAMVDGKQVGTQTKQEVVTLLDTAYRDAPVAIYFGDNSLAYASPKAVDLGITTRNEARIQAVEYPWYLRVVPTSILWAQFAYRLQPTPQFDHDAGVMRAYIQQQFGDSCNVAPKNASLEVVDNDLRVADGQDGGTCELAEIYTSLSAVTPTLGSAVKVTAPLDVIPADVTNSEAEQLKQSILARIEDGVAIAYGETRVDVTRDQLLSWITFDNSKPELAFGFSGEKAGDYLRQQLSAVVAVPAGVTRVNTYDFVEVSRDVGTSGRVLDVNATLSGVVSYIEGDAREIIAATSPLAPTIEYTRTYSPTHTGLSALMQNFAQTHAGTYGVALTELSGQYRRAAYRSDVQFTTASTYKLFVAYSTLRRIESGAWKWTDQVHGGRDLAKCFDDMIVVSDNECAHTLLERIGFTTITNEAKAIGMTKTSFLGSDGIKTSASDLALILAELQTGQILGSQTSRDIWINAMKRNIYRQGIPKGISGTVADKVGFLDALLHDAGIVYASTGTYVLAIMTEGSSWADIAQLTREIEALRIQ